MRTPEMYNNQARLVQADPVLAYRIKRSNPNMINQFGPLLRLQTLRFEIRNGKQVYCGELWDPKQKKSHDTLLKLIKERFQVQSPDIKYDDQDVDDCVDFDRDADELDLKTLVSRPQTAVNRSQTPISRPHTHVDRPQTPSRRAETSSRPNRCQSLCGGYLTLPSLSRQDTPSTSSASKYSSKPCCRQYKISKSQLSRSVLSKLESKEELTTSERRHFLDAIYNDVTKYAGEM
ncbi:Hypothetical predicted protein [Mytilus galloprovincialis]|uniref:Uncharacterized protein n=1 Tax=Mytilus galloprovincialis TaxID=29158 RepID=A0A8B6GLH2_MYTGA|nr:Hypothetical predicted protein [Mytilus galloprovincialis]